MFALTFYALLTVGNTYLTPPRPNPPEKHLQRCLKSIVKKHAKPQDLILSVNINFQINHPSIRIQLFEELDFTDFARINIYLINTEDDSVAETFNYLKEFQNFNPRAKFVVLSNNTDEVFKMAATFYMSHLAIVNSDSEVFTYFPYETKDVRNPDTTPRLLGPCTRNYQNPNLFGKKMPRSWDNSVLHVSYKPWEPYVVDPEGDLKGIEVFIVETLKKYFSFETQYHLCNGSYYDVKNPETYHEIYGGLMTRDMDVSIGALYLKKKEHRDFDVSYSYLQDGFLWVVPKARVLPQWERIVTAFSWRVWAVFLVSFVLFNLIYGCYLRMVYITVPSRLGVYFFGILLEIASEINKKYTIRRLLLFWIFYCLIISTAFKSQMMNLLSGYQYARDIDSVEEIIDSDLIINLPQSYANLYEDDSPNDKYIYDHNVKCDVILECLNRTARKKDTASLAYGRYIEYRRPEFLNRYGQKLIHVLRDQVFLTSVHMIFSKGFPIFDQINEILIWLAANGIVNYDFRFMEHIMKTRFMAKLRLTQKTTSNDLRSMALPFVLLAFGVGISVVVLGAEVVWVRFGGDEVFWYFYGKFWGSGRKVGRKRRLGKISMMENEVVLFVDGKIEIF